jgi:chaperonin GroEL
VGGKGKKEDIASQVKKLEAEKELAQEFDKKEIQMRLAKLSVGVAIIKVGAATEVEMKEKKDRIEDALNAAKSAVEEGIVPGGGLALLVASYDFSKINKCNFFTRFLKRFNVNCEDVINNAVLKPIKIIAENAGFNNSEVLKQIINRNKNYTDRNKVNSSYVGFNAVNGEYVDMVGTGIVDATKGVRLALENASSSAMMALTTDVTIINKLDNK